MAERYNYKKIKGKVISIKKNIAKISTLEQGIRLKDLDTQKNCTYTYVDTRNINIKKGETVELTVCCPVWTAVAMEGRK